MPSDGVTTARLRIRVWLRDRVEGVPEFEMPVIADECRDALLADVVFLRGPISDLVRAVALEELHRIGSDTRSGRIVAGTKVTTAERFIAQAQEKAQSRFAKWLEHSNGRVMHFMNMTSTDLILAATEREKRASTELNIARFERYIAGTLAEGQTVGAKFTSEQLGEIYTSIQTASDTSSEAQTA